MEKNICYNVIIEKVYGDFFMNNKILKKGFTLIELIGVLVIMAVILFIAVPSYFAITNSIKERMYEAKVSELKAKGESYGLESGNYLFSVGTLVEQGYLQADSENGAILDPRDKQKMNCDIIELIPNNDLTFTVNYISSKECFTDEQLNNQYGFINFMVKNDKNEVILDPSSWHQSSKDTISFEFKEQYSSLQDKLVKMLWIGEEEKEYSQNEIDKGKEYLVETSSIKQIAIRLSLTFDFDGKEITYSYTTNVSMDDEMPELVEGSIQYSNDNYTSENRKVLFSLTDHNGSGIKEYAVVNDKSCKDAEFKETTDGIQTEYLTNGTYYICARDKVGNEQGFFEDENKIVIEKVDSNSFWINVENVYNDIWTSNDVNLKLTTNSDNIDYCMYKNGNEEYNRLEKEFVDKTINILYNTDMNKKMTFQCVNKSGIKSNEVNTTIKIDKTAPSKTVVDFHGYTLNTWANYNVNRTFTATDNGSGIDHYEWSSDCVNIGGVEPSNSVPITWDNINYACHRAVDKVGNIGPWSNKNIVKVDKTKPTAAINTWCNGSSITVSANGSSDNLSGISTYYYSLDNKNWYSSTKNSYSFNTTSATFYVRAKDNAGNYSSSVSQTRSCGPIIKDYGNLGFPSDRRLDYIIPLGNGKVIGFYGKGSDSEYNKSFLEAWVLQYSNGKLTIGPKQNMSGSATSMVEKGGGFCDIVGARLTDSKVIVGGNSTYRETSSRFYCGSPTLTTVEVSGFSAWASGRSYVMRRGPKGYYDEFNDFYCQGYTCYYLNTCSNTGNCYEVIKVPLNGNGIGTDFNYNALKRVNSSKRGLYIAGDVENRHNLLFWSEYSSAWMNTPFISFNSGEYIYLYTVNHQGSSRQWYEETLKSSTGVTIDANANSYNKIARLTDNSFVYYKPLSNQIIIFEKINNVWKNVKTFNDIKNIDSLTTMGNNSVLAYGSYCRSSSCTNTFKVISY